MRRLIGVCMLAVATAAAAEPYLPPTPPTPPSPAVPMRVDVGLAVPLASRLAYLANNPREAADLIIAAFAADPVATSAGVHSETIAAILRQLGYLGDRPRAAALKRSLVAARYRRTSGAALGWTADVMAERLSDGDVAGARELLADLPDGAASRRILLARTFAPLWLEADAKWRALQDYDRERAVQRAAQAVLLAPTAPNRHRLAIVQIAAGHEDDGFDALAKLFSAYNSLPANPTNWGVPPPAT